MRISIIGQPGSGKTFLAQAISKKLDIPHLHLDRLWFEAGGNVTKKSNIEGRDKIRAYILERAGKFIEQEAWVSDGWYSKIQPTIAERAEVIIFLDLPLYKRIANHYWRALFDERHGELNFWDEVMFPVQMIRRIFTAGPKMRNFVRENAAKVRTLRSFKEINDYLAGIS